jgi:hypothetical protein
MGAVSPKLLSILESTLRRPVRTILDSLPIGEEFEWVKLVSEIAKCNLGALRGRDGYRLPIHAHSWGNYRGNWQPLTLVAYQWRGF